MCQGLIVWSVYHVRSSVRQKSSEMRGKEPLPLVVGAKGVAVRWRSSPKTPIRLAKIKEIDKNGKNRRVIPSRRIRVILSLMSSLELLSSW